MNITALIVTYNRLEKLQKSVKATLELPFTHIVIVNNDSSDGTQLWLDQITDPRVCVLSTQCNIGGAGGFKYGVEYIIAQLPCDWVVLYDDDAWPAKDFIHEIQRHDNGGVDALCSQVLDIDQNICAMNVPWKKVPRTLKENIQYLTDKKDFIVNQHQSEQVVTFSFVGCVIKYDVLINTYRYIVSDLFIYFDDVYYSYQLHRDGFILKYDPALIFYHDIDTRSVGKMPDWKVYYMIRNMLRSFYILKGDNFFTAPAVLLRMVKYMYMAGKSHNKKKYFTYYFKGVLDGVRNIGGNKH